MTINPDGKSWQETRGSLLPVRIVSCGGIDNPEFLLEERPGAVLYRRPDLASVWSGKGAYAILDFGREVQGGARIVVCKAPVPVKLRLTFGESLTEACSAVGEKNATNDHSYRDFEVTVGKISDNSFGQTGFRFLRVELLENAEIKIQSILAETVTALFEREASVVTNDPLLNRILDTAKETLRLCFQKGYLWDGIKRDRLIWCGDLHPEIITGIYLFGDVPQIRNSLSLYREYTPATEWINNIPSYSAWWIVNLCDYCRMTGNSDFWKENREYGKQILSLMRKSVREDGTLFFEGERPLNYFLDWSTHGHGEAWIGVASLFLLAAQKWLLMEENEDCRTILSRLSKCVSLATETKPVRAFQVLAGREDADAALLEKDGSRGFSTFMAYYILSAMAKSGGTKMLPVLKEYYGGMLSRGATTFWEDFDVAWLENSGRIDAFPDPSQKDIHGDFGKHCYQGFRHSLCHGWSAGVFSFFVEYVLGIGFKDGGKTVTFAPHAEGLRSVKASIPAPNGFLEICFDGNEWSISAPSDVCVVRK